jgi:hypothetical protein
MQEIAKFLVERGPFTPSKLLPRLRAMTLRGAILHKEPLIRGTLKNKMDARVSFSRSFVACDDGRYAHRTA